MDHGQASQASEIGAINIAQVSLSLSLFLFTTELSDPPPHGIIAPRKLHHDGCTTSNSS